MYVRRRTVHRPMNVTESQTRVMPSGGSFGFGFLLLFAISLPLTGVGTTISYGVVLIVYIVMLLFGVPPFRTIELSPIYLVLLCLLSGSLVLSGIVSPSMDSAIRIGAFFVFTLSNLLIIPYIISFRDMAFLAGRYAAGLLLIGFLPYFGVRNLLDVFDLSLWGAYLYLYPALQPITSIFINPNALGFVLLVGSIAAVIETLYSHRRVSFLLVVINVGGLLFTNYRTGMAVFGIVLSLCAVYVLFGRRLYVVAVASGLATFVVVLLVMFGVFPGPAWLTELSLNGRRLLWQDTVTAMQQAPLFGFGFGDYTEVVKNPHNSYLRMFLALGIGGGVIYAAFVLRTILQSSREATDWYTFGISLYLVAFFFVQMMNSLTFIGISFHSACISLMIGYHIRNDSLQRVGTSTTHV